MHKSKRAVDRIEYPTPPRSPDGFAFFLAENSIIRKPFRDLFAQIAFRFSICDRDITTIRLRARLQLLAVILQGYIPGASAELYSELEQFVKLVHFAPFVS